MKRINHVLITAVLLTPLSSAWAEAPSADPDEEGGIAGTGAPHEALDIVEPPEVPEMDIIVPEDYDFYDGTDVGEGLETVETPDSDIDGPEVPDTGIDDGDLDPPDTPKPPG